MTTDPIVSPPAGRRLRVAESGAWLVLAVLATAGLVAARDRVGAAHVALVYLLLVLGASVRSGRTLGLALATCCFLAFNYFFVPPYGTLAVRDPLDFVVLAAFLITSAVAAQLLHRLRTEADAARARSAEVQRLATLGAEALQAPRAEDAVAAVARVIGEELRMRRCELHLWDGASEQLELIARADAGDAARSPPAAARTVADLLVATDPRTLVRPLAVHDRRVGFLVLSDDIPVSPALARGPLADAFAFYAALGLERLRLARVAERVATLSEADRLKEALLSAVSHDLRTPLTTIIAAAHEIVERGGPAAAERAVDIATEAGRLNRYVTNLLDLSRLNAGAVTPAVELVPVDDLLGTLPQQLEATSTGREVRAAMDDDWPRLVARCDFVLALRVLANLVENALRHAPVGPVHVRATRRGPWVRISVADHGPGVPEDERDRIFEPFERGEAAGLGGTGLGLAIARRLSEAQGGSLEYEPREGGGSVFTLCLPAADVEGLEDDEATGAGTRSL